MLKIKAGLAAAGAAALTLAALAGCSRTSEPAADQSASSAPAASAPEAAAPTADGASYGTATQPGVTKIKLDIKVGPAGDPIYGDPANGKAVFNQCASCHAKEAGVNNVGPTLHGIIGRRAGEVAAFKYSAANKTSGLVWTEQELYAYLENPQKTVPGTYMTYTGVKDPQKRADVIAFLRENTK
jgi:cytochrome c